MSPACTLTLYDITRHFLYSLYRRTRRMSSLVLPLNIGPRMSCISPSLQAESELAPVTVEIDVVPSHTDIL